MKPKNYLLLLFAVFSLSFSAQEISKENDQIQVVFEQSEKKSNQLVLDLLAQDSRISNLVLKDIIKKHKNGTIHNEETNVVKNKAFGYKSPTVSTIYYDGEVILGRGINRLHVLDRVRTNTIEKIYVTNITSDKNIYIEKIQAD